MFGFGEIEKIIGYTFCDKELLKTAFTHSSAECGFNNERLEFLGDSLVNLFAAFLLYQKDGLKEGEMSRARAGMVSETPLAAAIDKLGLDKFIICGNGDRTKIVTRAVKADLFEAVSAAIYLDGGQDAAQKFVTASLNTAPGEPQIDYKTRLQIFAQKRGYNVSYGELSREGPAHAPVFGVAVVVGNEILGKGSAGKKRDAEQIAAREACERLGIISDLMV